MRKPTKKSALKRALKAMSDYIRERDNWTCITCNVDLRSHPNKRMVCDCGHFLTRRYKAILFDERNVHAQCVKCNQYGGGKWDLYLEAMKRKYGQNVIDELMSKRYVLKSYTIDEYLEIEAYYKDKLKNLTNNHL